jgi:hypothetical protein
VADGGGLAGLGRKWPSVHGFDRRLHRKIAGATENSSKGSGWQGGGRRRAHGGDAWSRSSSMESSTREGRGEGEKRLARILTAMWSFLSTCSTAGSGGAVSSRGMEVAAAEELWWLRVFGESGGCGLGKT